MKKENSTENNKNEINCIYAPKKDEKVITLLHDYNEDTSKWHDQEYAKLYLKIIWIFILIIKRFNLIINIR